MTEDTQTSYDRVAAEYANHVYNELRDKPFDRAQLDRLIEMTHNTGIICDLGCGPGQVSRYLADHGARTYGIDLSRGMIEQARQLNPDLHFQRGDMLALEDIDIDEASFAGITAFYSILHIPREKVADALREMYRVLRQDGVLLLAFHVGDETRHLDEWWGETVNVDFNFFEPAWMQAQLEAAGFTVLEALEREPYPEPVEVQTRRAYLFAQKLPENSEVQG